jgi:hypothetical protein
MVAQGDLALGIALAIPPSPNGAIYAAPLGLN